LRHRARSIEGRRLTTKPNDPTPPATQTTTHEAPEDCRTAGFRSGSTPKRSIFLNGHGLHPWEAEVIPQAGAFADRLVLASNPAVQACGRMRLPADYLYVHRGAVARAPVRFSR